MPPIYTAASVVVAAGVCAAIARHYLRRRSSATQAAATSSIKRVSPKARVLAVLGDPVSVTRTPLEFPAALARSRSGLDAVFVPLHVPPQSLPTAFVALREFGNVDGYVLTKPHKETGAALCDQLTPEARNVGASNVVRLEADGTVTGSILDGVGFCDGLASSGHAIDGKRFLLVGAGGAARAIAVTLRARGARRIDVINRTAPRARALIDLLASSSATSGPFTGEALTELPAGRLADEYDAVIQCTSLGHSKDDALPIDPERLRPPLLCAEVIHTPIETPFLAAARQQGCTCHHGKHMLDKQIDAICEFLTAVHLKSLPRE